ncbi:MAG: GspE/PulE family protein [Patescibacteria group bacterium]|nr:GspE/PulE family protein [Patescibacteria group bacterium]
MAQAKDLAEKLLKQRREAEENDAKRRAEKLGLRHINLISVKVPTEIKAMQLVSETEAKEALAVPLQILRKKLVLAAFDPQLPKTNALIEKLKKNYDLEIIIVSKSGLEHIWHYYQYVTDESKEISGRVEINEVNLKKLQESIKSLEDLNKEIKTFESPYTSEMLEIVLAGALALKASDIHLEPGEEIGSLRLRVDGLLHTAYAKFPPIKHRALVARVKLLSNLKLNIHDQPQDGRFTIKLKDRDIEIRTSVIPSEYGETIVMRLLDPSALKVDLEELGWRKDDLEIVEKEIQKPNGLILNTGPTGSGKTTTLYAFLRRVVKPEIKIITVEDPIEYHLAGVSQTQVDLSAKYTFASGLRSILRQDPDIILIGEIRDEETAEIALNASLTGHLVLSTLHTNNAVGAIPRLIDLGAKPQTLGPALSLIIAQRLVRTLCSHCKSEKKLSDETHAKIQEFIEELPERIDKRTFKDFKIYGAGKCEKCGSLGYRGRTSIFELFLVDEEVEEKIYKSPTEIELKNLAKQQGMVTMQEDGILKVLRGVTSVEEIERLTGSVPWLK